MAQRILALEYGGDEVRAALAERSWNQFALIGVFSDRRAADEPDLTNAFARLLMKTGAIDVVVSALPGELVAKRLLELPFHDRRRLEQAVPFALEEHLPFPIDDAVVSFATVGRAGNDSLVMAAMARKDDLRAHLTLLARSGLDPKTVTLSALALPALLARTRNGTPHSHLLLDIETSRTSIVLLDPSGAPRVVRTLIALLDLSNGRPHLGPESASILNAARQTMLSGGGAEAERPDVILTGPLSSERAVREEISRELSATVRGAEELDCAGIFEGLTPDAMRFAGCLSMLLSELPAAPVHLLNFRSGEFAFRGRVAQDLAPLRKTGMLAAAVMGAALLHWVVSIAGGYHHVGIIDRQIAAAAAPALGASPPAAVSTALTNGLAEMSKRMHLIGASGADGSPLEVLRTVSVAIPSDLSLDIDEMSVDESGLKIGGKAQSFGAVEEVKKALAASGAFENIQVINTKGGNEGGRVEFTLTALPRGGAPEAGK